MGGRSLHSTRLDMQQIDVEPAGKVRLAAGLPSSPWGDMQMPVIAQIAALPSRRDAAGDLQVLLVTSRTNRRWMLPKGWPMSGKSEAEAARVEALEEAGVQGIIDQDPIGSYGYVKDRGQDTARGARARVYALEVTDQLDQWDEMHQRERRWMWSTVGVGARPIAVSARGRLTRRRQGSVRTGSAGASDRRVWLT